MIKVVIDTNVLVSAVLLPKSTPALLVRRWQARKFLLVSCQQAIDELDAVLQRSHLAEKYRIDRHKREGLITTILEHVVLVPGTSVTGVVAADPADDVFVACAAEGNAKYIISGDKHLLALRRYFSVRIVKPAHFLAVLSRCQRMFE